MDYLPRRSSVSTFSLEEEEEERSKWRYPLDRKLSWGGKPDISRRINRKNIYIYIVTRFAGIREDEEEWMKPRFEEERDTDHRCKRADVNHVKILYHCDTEGCGPH